MSDKEEKCETACQREAREFVEHMKEWYGDKLEGHLKEACILLTKLRIDYDDNYQFAITDLQGRVEHLEEAIKKLALEVA